MRGSAGKWHTALPVRGLDTTLASRVTAVALPVPDGLAADLVESLDHPMRASGTGLRDLVPDPPGGRLRVEDAITSRAVEPPAAARQRAVGSTTTSPTAIPRGPAATRCESDGSYATVTPADRTAHPRAGKPRPGPIAGALRTGLDILITLTPKVRFA